MKNDKKESQIQKFIQGVKSIYNGDIRIDYEYDDLVCQYNIWHDKEEFQTTSKSIKYSIGKLMKELLFDEDIFDFYFAYDSEKAREVKPRYRMMSESFEDIEYTQLEKIENFINSELTISNNKAYKINYDSEITGDSYIIGKQSINKAQQYKDGNIYNGHLVVFNYLDSDERGVA